MRTNVAVRIGVVGLWLAGAGMAACDSESASTPSGEQYYSGAESAALGAAGNQAKCSTCHGNTANAATYPGDSLFNIAYHTSFKGGDAPTLRDAVNACVTGWMGGSALTADSAAWKALEGYLQSISDPAVTTPNTLMPEVLADEAAYADAYDGGDATAGAVAFADHCARCHGLGLKVGTASAPSKGALGVLDVGYIAQKVRTSGPPPSGTNDATDLTPGPMPFFEPDELSADALANIIAYLRVE